MVVVEGEHQRGHALGRRHIHIGAGADQRIDTVVAAVTRGIQQRGQSSNRTILRAGLGGDLAGPVGEQGARLEVGAFGKKQLHHRSRVSSARRQPTSTAFACEISRSCLHSRRP